MHALSSVTRMIGRGRLEAVTMELGRDAARISATAYAGGRVRLALGSGQEFAGGYQDLPAKVGAAAREVLDIAARLAGRVGRQGPDEAEGPGHVCFVFHTSRAAYAAESRLGALEAGRSRLAPLWDAFSRLMAPMIVTLFDARAAPAGSEREAPGLTRARRLWPPTRPGDRRAP